MPPKLIGIENQISNTINDQYVFDDEYVWLNETYLFDSLPKFLHGTTFFNMPMIVPQHTSLKVLVHKCSALFLSFRRFSSGGEEFDHALSNDGWKWQLGMVTMLNESSVSTEKSVFLDNTWRKLVVENLPQTIEIPELRNNLTGIIFISGKILIK